MLNHMLLINNVAYDREDYKLDISEEKEDEMLFYNNSYTGLNDWSGISEPVIFIIKLFVIKYYLFILFKFKFAK